MKHEPAPSVRVRGASAVTALGPNLDALASGLASGRRALSGEPAAGRVDRDAARVELGRLAPALEARAREPSLLFVALAFADLLERARATSSLIESTTTAVVLGTTKGVFGPVARAFRGETAGGAREGPVGAAARFLAEISGARGPVLAISQACASGSAAIAHAASLIESGEVERAIAGGVEALEPFVADGFACLRALDARGTRPFDRARAGLSLGEGAGLVFLERASRDDRGLFLRGSASASDARSSTSPDPEGRGLARAIATALSRGGISPREVSVVCAHGTGTEKNDKAELSVLARVLEGSRARVFSIKGHVGHTLGAAGALDAIAALLALETRTAFATAGLEDPERAPPLELPLRSERLDAARFALSSNAGFGGLNVALAFEVVT